MKILKNTLLILFIAVSSLGMSSIAVADANKDAVDNISAKVAEAVHAIEANAAQEEVVDLIRQATDLVKDLALSDALDVRRQRSNAHLKQARTAANTGGLTAAKEHLEQATQGFAELKKLL